ncbi:MAG TPA: DUF4136 domain-containing protein [Draconibacterium sp.]|nr:DUF4136 domain-containing protein [Draconibacterium sp.]
MKKYLLILVLFAFVGCASLKIGYDYDKTADFSKYKTFAISEETMKITNLNQLNRDRLINAAKAEMAAKGFTESSNPDVILDLRVKGNEVQTATATTTGGYGYGYGRWGYGGGFSTTQVNYDKYVEGSLFITLVDKATEKIVWQGTGKKTIDENASPEKKEASINNAVKQIFTNYPPQIK